MKENNKYGSVQELRRTLRQFYFTLVISAMNEKVWLCYWLNFVWST